MLLPIRMIQSFLLLGFFTVLMAGHRRVKDGRQESFRQKVVAKGLHDPWEVVVAPDGHLWVTESKAYRVVRIDPVNGDKQTLLDLRDQKSFPDYDALSDSIDGGKPSPQGGLMGMALHPRLFNGKPFVYLAYVYDFEGKDRKGDGHDPKDYGFHFKTKIVRYRYDPKAEKLGSPETICDDIPGSNDHNGGRLLISQIAGKDYVFYSVGDMGAGQYKNASRKNHAQDLNSLEGKILRFESEPDNSAPKNARWIPADNPFNGAARSPVWSLGHRNPQGLAGMLVNGKTVIFSSEHGPFSDDEINIIKRGKNYGHPLVIGYPDGNYDGLSAGVTPVDSLAGKWNTTYPLILDERANARALVNFEPPIKSFFPTKNSDLAAYCDSIRIPEKSPVWPSLAPSGIAAYTSDAIPGWKGSLLITSLKSGKLVRIALNKSGTSILEERDYFIKKVRYRDVAVSADGRRIYLTTDRSVVTSGPSKENPEASEEQGAILEFTYQP